MVNCMAQLQCHFIKQSISELATDVNITKMYRTNAIIVM